MTRIQSRAFGCSAVTLALLIASAMTTPVRAADGAAVPTITAAPTVATSALHFQTVEGEGGVPLNVVTAGDKSKPPILFVHGIGQSYVSWENQLRAPLTDEFFVVAFDLRGHGNSGKPWNKDAYRDYRNYAGDVQAVIKATQIDRPVLVGWSYGTLVVADYLRAFGISGLRGIVLTGAYGGFTPPPQRTPAPNATPQGQKVVQQLAQTMAEKMKLMSQQLLGSNLEDNIAGARAFSRILTAKEMPAAYYERATQISLMLPGYARRWMFDRPLANMDLIPQINVPILLNVGGKDPSTPEKDARDLAAKIKGAQVSVYAACGHSPFAEEPQRYNRELAEFARAALR